MEIVLCELIGTVLVVSCELTETCVFECLPCELTWTKLVV